MESFFKNKNIRFSFLIILYFAEIGNPRNLRKLVFKLYVQVMYNISGGVGSWL
jgi:hypothetical protein